MCAFTVSVSGRTRRLGLSWQRAATAWADAVEPMALSALRREAPVGQGPGSGRLRKSIRARRSVDAAQVVLTFTTSAPYAPFVLDGTAPHTIRPRRAAALHWEGLDGPVFAREVRHPGTRPNHFPQRALHPLATAIQARLEAAIAEHLNT